ncbi:hypothetical protein [Salinactinospora qingdaonensis]|uniref:Uncharacterized protein n=1 Tax=Salinactinospora qingdaonensis TaxID=702744 RepID=A0ABP7G5R7_9ACTN
MFERSHHFALFGVITDPSLRFLRQWSRHLAPFGGGFKRRRRQGMALGNVR